MSDVNRYGEYVTGNDAAVIRKNEKGEYVVYHMAKIDHKARRSFRPFEALSYAESYALGVLEGQHGTQERVGS